MGFNQLEYIAKEKKNKTYRKYVWRLINSILFWEIPLDFYTQFMAEYHFHISFFFLNIFPLETSRNNDNNQF